MAPLLVRYLAEEEAAIGGPGPVAGAVTGAERALARCPPPGSVASSLAQLAAVVSSPPRALRHAPLSVYLTKAVGGKPRFPDICEALVSGHLAVGDAPSAAVTSDWYCAQFEGWGRAKAHASRLASAAGRHEEARDAARAALASPWWSLGEPVGATLRLALWDGMEPEKVFRLAAAAAAGGGPDAAAAADKQLSPAQRAEAAAHEALCVAAAPGRGGWWGGAGGRAPPPWRVAADAWNAAGRGDVARLMRAGAEEGAP